MHVKLFKRVYCIYTAGVALCLFILVFSGKFDDSLFYDLPNEGKVAIAKVVPQFFQRVSYFYPRMSVSICLVVGMQVINVLDDISGMFQWKVQLVAFHGKHSLHTSGHVF